MKKTVLVLGCLLAIGFSSVSCNRDDGLPEAQVTPTPPAPTPTPTPPAPTPTPPAPAPALQRSDLPKNADHLIASMLGEKIYDATFTNKNVTNPFSASEVYTGASVKTITKATTANAANGAVYDVVLSNGIELGFKEDGKWAYVDGKGVLLKESAWSYLPLPVQTSVRKISSTAITEIAKMEVSTAGVYTITFKNGVAKKYNANGTAA
jgi:os02g0520500 protein